MKTNFSIGQLSALFQIPIKTLRYYDEIGLFKPVFVDKTSRYRYYSTEQFEQLHTIQYLKILGMPLKNIRKHLETTDMDSFLALLKEHKEITQRKITELSQVLEAFEGRIEEIELAKGLSAVGNVMLRQLPSTNVLRLEGKITSEPELELLLNELEQKADAKASIFIGKVGLTISKENLEKQIFDEYNSIFLLTERPQSISSPLYQPIQGGMYACTYFRGGHLDSYPFYLKILEFISSNSFEISGDAIERTIIDHFISKNPKDYLTEIRVPVKTP